MEFHMLSGIPGNGKSTLVQYLSGFVVSTDRIRKFLWDDESIVRHDRLVFEIAESIIKYILSLEQDVIFDATNLTIKKRKKYIALAKGYGAKVTVHWLDCPLDVAIEHLLHPYIVLLDIVQFNLQNS